MKKNTEAPSIETHSRARKLYADGYGLSVIADELGITRVTVSNWKKKDKETNLDWDKKRQELSAHHLSKSDFTDQVSQMMNRFLINTHKVQEELEVSDIPVLDKAEAISRISDAYAKLSKAVERSTPQLNELSVVKQTIEKLEAFIKAHYSQHLEVFVEILEPFAAEMAKHFRK